jgi:hypothetical protein
MSRKGRKVQLVGITLPIQTATETNAIAARSGRRVADVGRAFYAECWGPYLDRHPELKAMAQAGLPHAEIETETVTEAEAAPEKSKGEIAATA